jgi:Sensors of blue-light using FAD
MTSRLIADADTAIFSLTYCSRAAPNLGNSEIEAIVVAARSNNARRNITGWLVCGSGIFFQWLEGKREDVKQLMGLITADARHNTIVILSEAEDVGERLFEDWDMELVSADDIREVLLDAIGTSHDKKNVAALRMLLTEINSGGSKPGLKNAIDL